MMAAAPIASAYASEADYPDAKYAKVQTNDDEISEATLKTNGHIPEDGEGGAFGYAVTTGEGFDSAFAGDSKDKDKHESKYGESNSYKYKNNDNEAEQEIEQSQFSSQDSQCISGNTTLLSCNNVAVQLNNNTGNQALGQE